MRHPQIEFVILDTKFHSTCNESNLYYNTLNNQGCRVEFLAKQLTSPQEMLSDKGSYYWLPKRSSSVVLQTVANKVWNSEKDLMRKAAVRRCSSK